LFKYREAAPWNRVEKSEFDRLLDIAERIVARADLELSTSDICVSRGKSRRQFAEFFVAELPTIVDMMKKKLAEKKGPEARQKWEVWDGRKVQGRLYSP
jgi:hypothetical protein